MDAIQVVDPASKTASIVGHLPQPSAGAVAVVLDHHIYVAGGTASTSTTQSSNSDAPLTAVRAYDAATHHALHAGNLPVPTSFAAASVVGGRAGSSEARTVGISSRASRCSAQPLRRRRHERAGSPDFGAKFLIADRGKNRLLLLDDNNEILWTYPSTYAAVPPGGLYFPDDRSSPSTGPDPLQPRENYTIAIIGSSSGSFSRSTAIRRLRGARWGISTNRTTSTPKAADVLVSGGALALVQYFGLEEPRSKRDQEAALAAVKKVAPDIAANWPAYRDLDATLGGMEQRRGNVSEVWAWLGSYDIGLALLLGRQQQVDLNDVGDIGQGVPGHH